MIPVKSMGPIVKVGNGDLGGKARVLPFIQRLLDSSALPKKYQPHSIWVPETWVIATDCFSSFVAQNGLEECAEIADDLEVRSRFLSGVMSVELNDILIQYLQTHHLPLAVRSSALHEDTHKTATAGLFSTYFIPNKGPDRFRQLQEAVKLVFASAYYNDVHHFLRTHSIPREEGLMAVALESVVGTDRGGVYYPLVAGVAQSLNFFPVGQMRSNDGVAIIVMGLGSRAVDGQDGVRFCPTCPLVRPSLQKYSDILHTTQHVIDAVNLEASSVYLRGEDSDTILRVPLEELTKHPGFNEVTSVYDVESEVFFESILKPGPRVITFNRLLRQTRFPLPDLIKDILQLLKEGFGSELEIEFALDIEGAGKDKCFSFAILQARPMPSLSKAIDVKLPRLAEEQLLIKTDRALGNGAVDNIHHIVFVDPKVFKLNTSVAIAKEVAALNDRLQQEKHHYLLLGPGRWGSSNRAVGIPVTFRQIDQACLIAEIATQRLAVDPSQGTHFFHNMVSRQLFYLTIDQRRGHHLALDWLCQQPNQADTELVKLIHTHRPLSISINAQKKVGVVYFK